MHRSRIRPWRKIKNDDKSPTTMGNYQNFNETKRCFDGKKKHCFGFEVKAQKTLFS